MFSYCPSSEHNKLQKNLRLWKPLPPTKKPDPLASCFISPSFVRVCLFLFPSFSFSTPFHYSNYCRAALHLPQPSSHLHFIAIKPSSQSLISSNSKHCYKKIKINIQKRPSNSRLSSGVDSRWQRLFILSAHDLKSLPGRLSFLHKEIFTDFKEYITK